MQSPGFPGICALGASSPGRLPWVGANSRLRRGSIDAASRKCWPNLDTVSIRSRKCGGSLHLREDRSCRLPVMPQFASNEIL